MPDVNKILREAVVAGAENYRSCGRDNDLTEQVVAAIEARLDDVWRDRSREAARALGLDPDSSWGEVLAKAKELSTVKSIDFNEQRVHAPIKNEPRPWCVDLVNHLINTAPRFELYVFKVVWDDDGEPEVFIAWDQAEAVHCRVLFGEEDDQKRFGFVSFGVQGTGGIRKDIDPYAPDVISSIMHDCAMFARWDKQTRQHWQTQMQTRQQLQAMQTQMQTRQQLQAMQTQMQTRQQLQALIRSHHGARDALAAVGRAYLDLSTAQGEEERERKLWNSASSGHRKYWEKFLTRSDQMAVRDSLREAEQRTRAAEKALAEAVSAADACSRGGK